MENMFKWMNENIKSMWELVDYSDDMMVIEIMWGDWKHDHLRAKFLMKEKGWECINSFITEDDGSDCYSAKHFFYKIP